MLKITPYCQALAADIRKLPDISFRQDSIDLQLRTTILQDAILDICDPKKLANPELRVAELFGAYDKLKESGLYDELFSCIDTTGEKFAVGFNKSYHILADEIDPTVNNIEEDIDARLNESNEDEIITEPSEDDTATMRVMEWSKYLTQLGGTEFIINQYKSKYTYASMSFADITAAITPALRITSLTSNPDLKNELARLAGKACGDDEIAKFNLMKLFKLATDSEAFRTATSNLIELAKGKRVGASLANVCSFISTIANVLPLAQRCKPNLSQDTIAVFKSNINKVADLLMLHGYSLLPARKYFQNSLLIGDSFLNGDNYDDFVSKGGTEQDIRNHVLAYYDNAHNIKMPPTGISAAAILGAKDDIKRRKAQLVSQAKDKHSIRKILRTTTAVTESLSEYMLSLPQEYLPEGVGHDEFLAAHLPMIKQVGGRMDASPDENRSNLLFNFILNTHYSGTGVSELHHRLSAAIVDEAKGNHIADMDKTSRELLVANVGTNMVANFITTKLIDVE